MPSHNYGLEGIAEVVELGKDGPKVKANTGVVELRDNADTAYAVARGADPVGDDDLVTKRYLDTRASIAVTGQIDGGSPPAAGTAGRIYVVTTSGGTYSVNELYRDDGSAWVEITRTEGLRITVTDDLSGGTVEFLGDHVYVWDEDASEWDDIGPAPALTRAVRNERITIDYTDSGDNNVGAAVPANAIITGVKVSVTQAFDDNSADLIVGDAVDADRFMRAQDVKLKTVGVYEVSNLYLYGVQTQVIANLTPGTSTQGQALIYVEYGIQ